ncbi:hypothetical protein HUK76_03355 [Citrobacter portucalensis]|nr:hypothetical protein [Citrobacter portucalensis]
MLRCPSISDGRLSYQFSSDGYIRRSVYAYDGCVARLKKYRPEGYELIIAHFVVGISLRTIAKRRKCCDGTIRKELQTAIGFVDGCLAVVTDSVT